MKVNIIIKDGLMAAKQKIISVTLGTHDKLNIVREQFLAEHGIDMSISKTIDYLIHCWDKEITGLNE